uniref:Uncharacterized protein n=1 Tax=Megaselia scalaris TaxID=36166 RepID=T1H3Y9_MEGSC
MNSNQNNTSLENKSLEFKNTSLNENSDRSSSRNNSNCHEISLPVPVLSEPIFINRIVPTGNTSLSQSQQGMAISELAYINERMDMRSDCDAYWRPHQLASLATPCDDKAVKQAK